MKAPKKFAQTQTLLTVEKGPDWQARCTNLPGKFSGLTFLRCFGFHESCTNPTLTLKKQRRFACVSKGNVEAEL